MATTQNRTFFGGSTSTGGGGVYPEEVKILKLFRNYAETDYDPLASSGTSVYIPTVEKVNSSGANIQVTIQKILASDGYPILAHSGSEYGYIRTSNGKYVFTCINSLDVVKQVEVDTQNGTITAGSSGIGGVTILSRTESDLFLKITTALSHGRMPVIMDNGAYYHLIAKASTIAQFGRTNSAGELEVLAVNNANQTSLQTFTFLQSTGDASNTTSTFTKAIGDTSTTTSGSKLSAIFTAISDFFASLKALAFKDTASYDDLSSGVQSSLDKADTALQSHQSVTNSNPTLAWGDTSTVGTVGGTSLQVTMPSNPASGKLDSTGDASNTTSTFTKSSGDTSGTVSGSKLSAIFTAISSFFASLKALAFKDKVSDSDISGTISDSHIASASTWNGKQNSLGISASGDAGKFLNERGVFTTPNYPSVPSVINNLTSSSTTDALSAAQGKALNDWKASNTLGNVYGIRPSTLNISGLTGNTWYNLFDISIGTYTSIPVAIKIQGRNLGLFTLFIRWPHSGSTTPTQFSIDSPEYTDVGYTVDPNNSRLFHIWLKTPSALNTLSAVYEVIGHGASPVIADGTQTATSTEPTNLVRPSYYYPIVARGGKGSQTIPVYVDTNGQVKQCTPSQMSVGWASNVDLSKTVNAVSGDSIQAGTGASVTIGNAGNAKKWDGHAISIGEVSASAGTISIV